MTAISESSLAKKLIYIGIWSTAYLLLSYVLVGFKTDQLVLLIIINSLYLFNKNTRSLLITIVPFIIFWVLFDYMKAFPNYEYNTVQIESLYNAEKNTFGFEYKGMKITPNEYFNEHNTPLIDFFSGIFYLLWVPVPIAFTIWLHFKKSKKIAFRFACTFLLVNLIGFLMYYLLPAAPPWYVQEYGFTFNPDTPGHTAGLKRFDELLGIQLFTSMYEKSSNVFAAMPSLHSAYPLVTLYYGLKLKLGKINWLFALIALGIWLSAVYSGHHYIFDVLGGIFCAFAGIGISEYVVKNEKK